MTTALATTYALALEIRQLDTGAVLGVALVVPSGRHLSFLSDSAGIATSASLPDETWREIDAWAAEGNAGLPAQPAPLGPSIVAAFLGEQPSAVSARRFAALPITVAAHDDLGRLAKHLLPGLLNARRSAT